MFKKCNISIYPIKNGYDYEKMINQRSFAVFPLSTCLQNNVIRCVSSQTDFVRLKLRRLEDWLGDISTFKGIFPTIDQGCRYCDRYDPRHYCRNTPGFIWRRVDSTTPHILVPSATRRRSQWWRSQVLRKTIPQTNANFESVDLHWFPDRSGRFTLHALEIVSGLIRRLLGGNSIDCVLGYLECNWWYERITDQVFNNDFPNTRSATLTGTTDSGIERKEAATNCR